MKDYGQCSDSKLVNFLRSGDNFAFLEIYERYNGLLFAYAFRKLHNKQESQDVVQDVFVKLWEQRQNFVLRTYLSGFLYKSVLNKILDIWKHDKVVRQHAEVDKLNVDIDAYETDFLIREKEIAAMIEKEIAAMPPRMREVYDLKFKLYWTTKAIAAELGISEHTVSNHLKNASAHLKKNLDLIILLVYVLKK